MFVEFLSLGNAACFSPVYGQCQVGIHAFSTTHGLYLQYRSLVNGCLSSGKCTK